MESPQMKNMSYAMKILMGLSLLGIIMNYVNSVSVIGLVLTGLSMFFTFILILKYYFTIPCFSEAIVPSVIQLLLICLILSVLIYQSIMYGSVNVSESSEYQTFSSISDFLLFLQVGLIFYYLFMNMNCIYGKSNTPDKDKTTSVGIMYLNIIFSLVNITAIGIIQVILTKYFIC